MGQHLLQNDSPLWEFCKHDDDPDPNPTAPDAHLDTIRQEVAEANDAEDLLSEEDDDPVPFIPTS